MADRNVITDSLKGELESFIRYSWASVAAVATFLLYMLAKGCSECELQRLPSVDVFGIKIEEGQLIFAVLLVPVVQIFQLRPLQSIADFITHHRDSLDTGKLVLITAPSVLNPFHIAGGKAGTYIDWMSWAVCSITITFYPSISISILLITFTGDSFAWDYSILKKAIYTLISDVCIPVMQKATRIVCRPGKN